MNLELFKKRISGTILMDEETKKYFLSQADSYSPEFRAGIISRLNKEEKEFLEFGRKLLMKKQGERQKKLREEMLVTQAKHKEEGEIAELQLEDDLKFIS